MTAPDRVVRITVLMTHPIQYFAPWFRWIAARCLSIDLTVLYAAVPTAEQQGRAYGRSFQWDAPLLDGYRYEVCREDSAGLRFEDDAFWGIDVPGIGDRIAATRPDAVLVAGWHAAVQVRALLACRGLGIPVIYRGDTTLGNAPSGWRRGPWRVRTWALLRLFDGWLSAGTRASEYLQAFGLPPERIAHAPHCVDHDWFAARADEARASGARDEWRREAGLEPGDFAVLYVGRVYPHKRPLDAVEAVAGLGSRAVLIVAGDGPQLDEVRAVATARGVRLVTPGFLNQGALPLAYSAADVLILPSRHETWGLVVNEALAAGLPCVVSEGVSAGVDLVTDGETGHRVPVGDVAAIREALMAVREGVAEGRYAAGRCRQAVAGQGFAEATDGLLRLARRLGTGRASASISVVS